MQILKYIAWYDKNTEDLIDEKEISDYFSPKELCLLLGEKEELHDCYPLSQDQLRFLSTKFEFAISAEYDYFIEISGDWELHLEDCIWVPAPASEFTDKSHITYQQAEDAFNSGDPEQIKDALIRTVFFDSNPQRIQEKCLIYLESDNAELQREAIVGIGHLARIHGKVDKDLVIPKLKALSEMPALSDAVEEALESIESYLDVRRK